MTFELSGQGLAG